MIPIQTGLLDRRKLRVLYVEAALGYGGSGKSLVELVRSTPDIDARILAGFPIADFVTEADTVEVEVNSALVRLRDASSGRLISYFDLLCYTARWIRAIKRSARRHRADIVHANNGLALNLAAIIACRSLGVPLVVHQRGWEERTRRFSLARALLGKARVIAISEAIAHDLSTLGIANECVSQIYDVVIPPLKPLEDSPRVPGPWRVAMHGVLNRWKGHDTFLSAAALLNARRPGEFLFRIAGMPLSGDDEYRRFLDARARELNVEQIVHFDGFVRDIYEWLRGVDISVHASTRAEPLGRVIVEAQLAGRPVIAARGGGANELVESGVTGLMFEPGSATELANAIERLASDPHLRKQVAVRAEELARSRFNQTRLAARVRRVYDEIGPARDALAD
jgi:glycosyltransferase involved in cell wall biosynthesis